MKFKKPKFWDKQKISIWSILLFPLSIIYLTINFIIKNFKTQKKFAIPVICIGNIYLGGTGKTPLVRKIFNISKSFGKNPAFIKKYHNYLLDEINMLKETGRIYTHEKREKSIFYAVASKHDLVILDDGFQDFTIKADFSILCFNSKQSVGNGFIIPSGPLRESLAAISRADCVVINGEKNLELENKIRKSSGKKEMPIFYSKYKIKNIEKLQNKEIIAFAGIGNPTNFFDLLKENNLNIKKSYSFPDHHNYSQKDFDKIKKDISTIIVTTEKDYHRIHNEQKKNFDYVEVNLEIKNEDKLKNLIQQSL
ncbi:tetraacyldisaccharide 4'-kinase [Candidatus Pelagibacter sp.]|nr:tetraacyldisaccharide 4'-kinase [Candidatus Pelagibacter sp.]